MSPPRGRNSRKLASCADTVVTSDVPDGCTAIGNPVRLTNCPEPAPAA